MARRSLLIVRYTRARARIFPYGEQSRFFVLFSLKTPLTVCLCCVPKIGGLINSSNYGLSPLRFRVKGLLSDAKNFEFMVWGSPVSDQSHGRAASPGKCLSKVGFKVWFRV